MKKIASITLVSLLILAACKTVTLSWIEPTKYENLRDIPKENVLLCQIEQINNDSERTDGTLEDIRLETTPFNCNLLQKDLRVLDEGVHTFRIRAIEEIRFNEDPKPWSKWSPPITVITSEDEIPIPEVPVNVAP